MKRKAEYELDRDNLDNEEDRPVTSSDQAMTNNQATPEQMAQRRIVKLKLPSEALAAKQGEDAADKPAPKFQLAGALNTPAPETSAAPVSFLSNLNKPVEATTEAPKTTETEPAKPAGGLFSGLANSTAPGGLFGTNKPAATPGLFSQGGLFGQTNTAATPSTGGGLFSSIFGGSKQGLANIANKDYSYVHKETGEQPPAEEEKPKPQAAKPAESKPSLFANLNNFQPGGGLFSGIATGSAATPASTGTGLFGGLTSGTTGGLFSAGAKPSTTLFSGLSSGTGGGLFGKGGDDDDEDGEEGDDEPERSPSPEADITKSKGNYTYSFDYDKLCSKKVNKFKPGAKEILLEGEVSFNQNKEGGSTFIIYRNKAKLIQYQGQVYKGISKTEYLNPRQDALSVVTFSAEAGEKKEGEAAAKPKITKDIIKIMFATSDDCNEFKKEVDKIVNA